MSLLQLWKTDMDLYVESLICEMKIKGYKEWEQESNGYIIKIKRKKDM